MRRWELTVALDPSRRQPLFLQLASAIAEDVRSGRLEPGDPLPGSRELAERLGLTRNTVVAGYQELAAEGLVSSRVGRGTFVSTPPAGPTGAVMPPLPEPTYGLGSPRQSPPVSRPPPRGTLMMSRGVPDPRLLPSRPLARAFARAVGHRGKTLLTYADLFGHRRLREDPSRALR